MNLSQAQVLAVSLMRQHGIWNEGWRFQYDNSVRRFGVCKYRSKTIGLSHKLVTLNDEEKVKDTILHEIALAIAGFKAGHGFAWQQVCIRIGAKPERCYTKEDTNTPKLKYHAVCGGCGKVHEKARLVNKTSRRACMCQSHLPWDKKQILIFKTRY